MMNPAPLLRQIQELNIPSYPATTGVEHSITLQSLAGWLYALCWAGLLLIAFAGWGRLIGKVLRVQRLPVSVACALGIGAVVFIGGWMNLLHSIYAGVLFALIGVGLLLHLWLRATSPEPYRWRHLWSRASPTARTLLIAALVLLAFRTAASVRPAMLNNLDDGAAYLVFPHKILELHVLATDPFSDRRITASLGGGYFLQVLVVSGTSLANAAMADRTLGLLLLFGGLFDIGVAFELSALQIALLELLALLVPQETMNLTFIVLPLSMLLAMLWMILETSEIDDRKALRQAFLAGVVGGAVISLKSTYLPIVGAFALIPYSTIFAKNKKSGVLNLSLAAGLGSIAVLAAWMIAMKQTSGTYLFPLLGRGFDYSAYGKLPSIATFYSVRSFAKIFLQGGALLTLACLQLFLTKLKSRKDKFSFWVLISAAVAITAFNYKSGGDSIWRYNFPQFFAAVIVLFAAVAFAFHAQPRLMRSLIAYCGGIAVLVGMIFYYDAAGRHPAPFREVAMTWKDYKPSLRASLSGLPLASSSERQRYRSVESSIPAGTTALENTAYPYLFDYRSRQILIADWPSAASLPPGWPYPGPGKGLADYLEQSSIRYVIYDYGYARWTDAEGCVALENPRSISEWLHDQWLMNILAHNQFDHLRARYHSIYDDGTIAVIDLGSPIANAPAETPGWTLHTGKDEICSNVMAAYLKHPVPATKGL
jgi:hypothetical protein